MLGIKTQFDKELRKPEPAEPRRVEDELKQSYDFTRAILDSINDPISILDVHTFEIVGANATFIRMIGKPLEELVGKPCYLAIHGRNEICAGPDQTCPLLEMRETGKYASAEHIRYRDGKMKIAEVSASPIRDEHGTIVQVVHVAHDITARKLAEEAVRKNEEHLQNILDSVRAGIVLADPAKHEIIYVNPYAAELMGVPKEQIIGRQCHDFICEAEREHCPIVEEHIKVENYERNLPRVNGASVPVLESVVPITFEGRELFIESFIDISGLKKAEEALQEINEEMRNFAYIVSHDLRAPLVSIKGFSAELQNSIKDMQPLLDKCAAALDEKERKQLAQILQEDVGEALGFIGSSVNRMDGLIGNILNLSRLGRKELKPEPLDMTEISRAILASLAHQIEEKKVTVTVAELPEIVADRVSMEQIMGNLIDNALKYMESGRDGELSISAEQKNNEVTFRVRDNGRGIAPEDMHKVFELFRRAGKQDTKGEGMGLAYVKTLVRRHGGRIWCDSTLGLGSTFSFSIAAAVQPG